MVSHKIYTPKNGFTLIEMLVVLSIFILMAGAVLSALMDSFQEYSFQDEQDTLVSTLQKARSDAMNNVCIGVCSGGQNHGVHFESNRYIIFQGNIYNPIDVTNEIIPYSPSVSLHGLSDVVFSRFSGNASTTPEDKWDIVLSDTLGHTSTTTVNTEGQITWTK